MPRWVHEILDILKSIREEARHDNIVLVAAGVAFYAVLAILPALFITVSLYGFFTDPAEVERQIESILEILPSSGAGILETQMRAIASTPQSQLSIGFAVSLAALFWTVSNATRAIVGAIKIAYDQETERSHLEKRSVALGLSFVAIIGSVMLLAIIAAVPIWLQQFDPTHTIVTFGNFRWLLLVGGFGLVVGLLYRYAPPIRPEHWRRVLPGVILATTLWLASSIGFSVYVSSFGKYNETYGTLGGAVVLLLWFWFTSLAIIVGAELNEILTLRKAVHSEVRPS
ncbi:MAG: YihY/virulence factor BrkB family protein [Actinomycetia bacterium]|nr:YihY/virulence factor BrkB family protein [Actinomycetes bacterium]